MWVPSSRSLLPAPGRGRGGRLAPPLLTVGLMHRSRPVTAGGFLPLHYDAQDAGVDIDVPMRDARLYELGHLGGRECRSRRIEKLQHLESGRLV